MDHFAVLKGSVVAIVGVCFFFAIVGVFGLSTSLVSLVVFISVSLWIFNHHQRLTGVE